MARSEEEHGEDAMVADLLERGRVDLLIVQQYADDDTENLKKEQREEEREIVIPELVDRILDQLDERDQQTPRMRTIDDQALEQNARDLFLQQRKNIVLLPN